MGTRGLTAVMLDGKYRIAQYGQWDHYPDGQGMTALEFCRKWLTDPVKASQFASQLGACRFVTDDEVEQAYKDAGADGSGFVSMDVVNRFQQRFPLINRDHGADILELVAGGEVTPELKDSISFAGESLFCEYAYVVDLDAGTFEVYKGFNKAPVPAGERFADAPRDKEAGEYYPVRLLAKWVLAELPTKAEFMKATSESDED